jgi:acetolactate synthase small subunit
MLVLPATAQLGSVAHLNLLVSDRADVPQRVMATCCRRQGAVVALTFTRHHDGTAELELAVEVEPRLRRGMIDRIAGLVDVLEVRDSRGRPLAPALALAP